MMTFATVMRKLAPLKIWAICLVAYLLLFQLPQACDRLPTINPNAYNASLGICFDPTLEAHFEKRMHMELTRKDWAELSRLYDDVYYQRHKATLDYRRRFCAILAKVNGTPAETWCFCVAMALDVHNLPLETWQDARISYKYQKPYLSERRAETDAFYLTFVNPYIPDFRERRQEHNRQVAEVKHWEALIIKAAGRPNLTDADFGEPPPYKIPLESFEEQHHQLHLLFTHP